MRDITKISNNMLTKRENVGATNVPKILKL